MSEDELFYPRKAKRSKKSLLKEAEPSIKKLAAMPGMKPQDITEFLNANRRDKRQVQQKTNFG